MNTGDNSGPPDRDFTERSPRGNAYASRATSASLNKDLPNKRPPDFSESSDVPRRKRKYRRFPQRYIAPWPSAQQSSTFIPSMDRQSTCQIAESRKSEPEPLYGIDITGKGTSKIASAFNRNSSKYAANALTKYKPTIIIVEERAYIVCAQAPSSPATKQDRRERQMALEILDVWVRKIMRQRLWLEDLGRFIKKLQSGGQLSLEELHAAAEKEPLSIHREEFRLVPGGIAVLQQTSSTQMEEDPSREIETNSSSWPLSWPPYEIEITNLILRNFLNPEASRRNSLAKAQDCMGVSLTYKPRGADERRRLGRKEFIVCNPFNQQMVAQYDEANHDNCRKAFDILKVWVEKIKAPQAERQPIFDFLKELCKIHTSIIMKEMKLEEMTMEELHGAARKQASLNNAPPRAPRYECDITGMKLTDKFVKPRQKYLGVVMYIDCVEFGGEVIVCEPAVKVTKEHVIEEYDTEEYDTEEHDTEEHVTEEHVTGEHDTEEHDTKEYVTQEHVTGEHDTEEHDTKEYVIEKHVTKEYVTEKYDTEKYVTEEHNTEEDDTEEDDTEEDDTEEDDTEELNTEARNRDKCEKVLYMISVWVDELKPCRVPRCQGDDKREPLEGFFYRLEQFPMLPGRHIDSIHAAAGNVASLKREKDLIRARARANSSKTRVENDVKQMKRMKE